MQIKLILTIQLGVQIFMQIVYYNEHRLCMFQICVQKNMTHMLTSWQKANYQLQSEYLISVKHTTSNDTSALIIKEEMYTTK